MPLPKLKDINWVTTDCYGTLIDWEKGIGDAFKREADRDGLTIDERSFLDRFFEMQAQIMSGSYELYAEVLRRAAVQTAEEIGWTIEPSRAQFLPDSVGSWPPFREANAAMDRLKVSRDLAQRYLNDGFSGGEKKRVEILQMAMLKPRIAVLDETDSGLDIDALQVVAGGVKELVGPEMGALVITHYQRILNYIEPDFVHVFVDGKIVEEGGPELAHKLEAEGYEGFGANGRSNGSHA